MSDIFISYASEDRDRIEPLAKVLAKQGWSVWWDRDIPFSERFDRAIKEALSEARCVVVAWSKISIESPYVLDEAESGRKQGVLFPILLDPPNDDLPPLSFRRIQWADLQDWDGTDTHHPILRKLVADITSILEPNHIDDQEVPNSVDNSFIKIMYPVADQNLKKTAEPIKESIEKGFPGAKIIVYSQGDLIIRGSINTVKRMWRSFSRIFSRSFQTPVNIVTSNPFKKIEIDKLSDKISSVEGVYVQSIQLQKLPADEADADIIVKLGP